MSLRARPLAATCLLLTLTVAMVFVATPGHALRHLRLVRSFPSANTVLATSPDSLRLWLSDVAEMPATKITLTTASGAAVTLGRVTRGAAKGAPIVAAVAAPIKAGTYNVAWRTMSRDGHVVKGAFSFRVGLPVARAK